MGRDNAPIGNTCPMIDNILSNISNAKGEAEWINNNMNGDPEDIESAIMAIIEAMKSAEKEMEDVRDANASLREWGNEQHDRAEGFEDEYDKLMNEVEDLKNTIQDLNGTIEDLQAEAELSN